MADFLLYILKMNLLAAAGVLGWGAYSVYRRRRAGRRSL